ncbi:MAG: hypothetical protein ACI4VK_04655 [Candidatus Coproplasma sp.]
MKLSKTLTISLAAVLSAATICTGTAFAEEDIAQTVYPESFERSLVFDGELTDYAVYGDNCAFAYNGKLAVLSSDGNGQLIPDINAVSNITGLEYSAQGQLYVCYSDGYCVYPDSKNKLPLSDITVQDKEQYLVSIGGVSYALDKNDGSMLYIDGSITTVTLQEPCEGEVKFSKLKSYNGTAYAVMNNCLYEMDGATAIKVDLTYHDVSIADTISTGDAAEALKSDSPIVYGWLEKNRYYTEINLESELGSTFEIADSATATTLSADRLYCTVLAESGNAYIITIGGNSYLTAKTSVSVESTPPALASPDIEIAYAINSTGIYSKPYLSPTTKIGELESGSANAVTVLGQYTDLIGTQFYKIKYTKDDGTVVTGYTAKRLMTAYAFPNEDNEENVDGDQEQFVYDSNVVTVVLAIAIVGLVLIAILYIAITSSINESKRRKKQQQKNAAKNKRRNQREDDEEDDGEEEE